MNEDEQQNRQIQKQQNSVMNMSNNQTKLAETGRVKKTRRFYQFKSLQIDNAYVPKLKVHFSRSEIFSLGYVYKKSCLNKSNNLEEIGNIQEWSQSKQKNNQTEPINAEIVSQYRRKGINDYTLRLQKKEHASDSSNTNIFVIGCLPFESDKIVNYFQICIQKISINDKIPNFSFGLSNTVQKTTASKNDLSFQCNITSQGILEVYQNSNKIEELLDLNIKVNDTFGCGFIYHRSQVFITYNGQIILQNIKVLLPESSQTIITKRKTISQVISAYCFKYHPFVSLNSKQITANLIFENSFSNFKFDYLKQVETLQETLTEKQITNKSQISEQSVYGLVLNYLKFYGYEKSGQSLQAEMMKRNMKFYPQNQPIKNKLQYAKKHQKNQSNQFKRMNQSMKQKRIRKGTKKSGGGPHRRNRCSSEDEIPEQISGNKSENDDDKLSSQNDQYEDKPLKKILERNFQNSWEKSFDEHFRNEEKLQKKAEERKRTEQQKFKTQRIQIMKIIEQGQIQKALKLFSSSYKSIFLEKKCIQIFFKAHIFLKHYHSEGLQKALEYAKKQHKSFTQYENFLMPFFNIKSIKDKSQNECHFRPLRQILFLICPQNSEQFYFEKQLRVFAKFISVLICEEAGFFGCSKLQLILDNFNLVQHKIAEYQIPVGGISFQALNLI